MLQRMGKAKANSKGAPKSNPVDEETLNELREAFKIFDSKNTGKRCTIQERSMRGSSRQS
jgi:Ca2+-binding EF-hand superfamily protein